VSTIETMERDGYRVRIEQDPFPSHPREDRDSGVHALTIDTRHGHYLEVDEDGGPLAEQWERISWRKDAIDLFKRYARIYHGAVVVERYRQDGPVVLWYMTEADVKEAGIEDPAAYIEDDIREYEQWADNEVYGYTVEKRVSWKRCGTAPSDEQYMWTWETVAEEWDIFGLDDARKQAGAVLSQAVADQREKRS
jgi:hypothetical protein